jgi:hypothetical protein
MDSLHSPIQQAPQEEREGMGCDSWRNQGTETWMEEVEEK